MDSEDKYLKELLADTVNEAVPYSFTASITRKIELERVKRAKKAEIKEIFTQITVFTLALLLLIVTFVYLGKHYFEINFDFSLHAGEEFKTGLSKSGERLRNLFLNPESVVWYVIALNTALLVVAQQVLQHKFGSVRRKERK